MLPRGELMRAPNSRDSDPDIRRVTHSWMRDRASRVRARSTTGTFLLGNLEKSQRGRPQGGFLSPILTPLFLTLRENDVPVNEYWHDFKDLLYADAVSGKTIVPSREILRKLATLHLSRIRVLISNLSRKLGDN